MAVTTMAIVVLISGPLGRRLNRLQRRLDPEGQGRLPAHIPLVGPFRARASFLPLEQHCWEVCHQTAPFPMELGPPVVDEGEGLVYAQLISGQDRLIALREALLTGKYAPPRDDTAYRPRAVVARLVCRDELVPAQWEMGAAATSALFSLERVELMAQYPDGTWYERDFYTLDRAVTRA